MSVSDKAENEQVMIAGLTLKKDPCWIVLSLPSSFYLIDVSYTSPGSKTSHLNRKCVVRKAYKLPIEAPTSDQDSRFSNFHSQPMSLSMDTTRILGIRTASCHACIDDHAMMITWDEFQEDTEFSFQDCGCIGHHRTTRLNSFVTGLPIGVMS